MIKLPPKTFSAALRIFFGSFAVAIWALVFEQGIPLLPYPFIFVTCCLNLVATGVFLVNMWILATVDLPAARFFGARLTSNAILILAFTLCFLPAVSVFGAVLVSLNLQLQPVAILTVLWVAFEFTGVYLSYRSAAQIRMLRGENQY